MRVRHITLTEAAAADVFEQAEWYEAQADRKQAERWVKAAVDVVAPGSQRILPRFDSTLLQEACYCII